MTQDKAHPTPAVAVPSDEILPCPFCGQTCAAPQVGETYRWRVVVCGCGARGPDARVSATPSNADNGNRHAVAMWNARATPPSLPAAQAVEGQPTVAYMTPDEDGSPLMLFFDRKEALTYCDDGEAPIELVARTSKGTEEAEGARQVGLRRLEQAAARYYWLIENRSKYIWGNCLYEDETRGCFDVDAAIDRALAGGAAK